MARLGRSYAAVPLVKGQFLTQQLILFDAASNSGYQTAQSSYTFNRTCSGNSRFLGVDVEILSVPGTTVTSVIDDSGGGNVAMTFIGAQSTVSGAGRVESWGLVAPALGTKSIQVNLSASVASGAGAISYQWVHQTTPTEAFNSAQATNVGAADATVNVTTITDNCWVRAAVATDDTAITANQTSRNNVTGALGSGADEDNNGPKTPAGSVTMSYSNVGALATWAIAGYGMRPISAPGGNTLVAPLGSLTLSGLTPTFDQGHTLAAVLGTLTLQGLTPIFDQGNTLAAPLGTLTLNGLTPTFEQGHTLSAVLGTLTLQGLTPTFDQGNEIIAPLGTLTLQGLTPTFDQGHTMEAPLGALTLNGPQAQFVQSGGPPTTVASYHSWYVKPIGVKTKISTESQVDGDTGDTP